MALFIRMAIYTFAIPGAAYFGGTYDPATHTLIIDLAALEELAIGFLSVIGTFWAGRRAKASGGLT